MTEHQVTFRPTVLITGTSTGIGAACATALAKQGWHVFAGIRKLADAEPLGDRTPGAITPVLIDVTDEASIAAAAETVGAATAERGLNALVNNAGVIVPGPLELQSTASFRRQLEVNVLGVHAVTAACLPLVRTARGRIVFMGSIAGLVSPPLMGAYAASKHALEAMADALRIELRPWGIKVSLIEPGAINTPIWEKFANSLDDLNRAADPEVQRAYEAAVRKVAKRALHMGAGGAATERVVRAVIHALTARRPKSRYPLGLETWAAWGGARHVPPAVLDWILRRAMGL
ncbi:MAG: SDR family oxidoreductase [Planctomycetes bacterium]|nr:SDR family oxidoreductase [Planctomycetota bacterium]